MTVFRPRWPTPGSGLNVRRVLRRPPRPHPGTGRPLSWRQELLIVAVIYLAYEASRGVTKSTIGAARANGRDILSWETSWHLAPERLLNHLLQHSVSWEVVSAYFYSTMHYAVTPAVLMWMFCRHSAQYRLARTTLALSTIIGLVGYYFLPTAPPRLLPHSGISDTLARVAAYGWWSNHGSVPRGLGQLSNQFAAMPSLHVGWAIWAGFLLARYGRWTVTRVVGVLYPLTTTLVVLATGNHYLLDAVAGGAAMLLAAGLAYAIYRRGVVVEAEAIVEAAALDDLPEAARPTAA